MSFIAIIRAGNVTQHAQGHGFECKNYDNNKNSNNSSQRDIVVFISQDKESNATVTKNSEIFLTHNKVPFLPCHVYFPWANYVSVLCPLQPGHRDDAPGLPWTVRQEIKWHIHGSTCTASENIYLQTSNLGSPHLSLAKACQRGTSGTCLMKGDRQVNTTTFQQCEELGIFRVHTT